MREISVKDKKQCLRNKKDYKLETLECILKKTFMLWKLSSLSLKKLVEFLPKNQSLKNTDSLPTNKHN